MVIHLFQALVIGLTFIQILLECTTPQKVLPPRAWDCWWRPEAEPTHRRNLALQWRPPRLTSRLPLHVCVCVSGCNELFFCTFRGKETSASGYLLLKGEIKHIKPFSVVSPNKKTKKWAMLDMQNNLKLNQTINQSINQWENKNKQKSVFTPASVRLSKNNNRRKKMVIKWEMWQTEG